MGTGSSGADADLGRLVSSFERLVRHLRRLTRPDGLSLTAASTLNRLAECGAQRISDLAVAEGVTQPAMTQLVTRLELQGLAERKGDPADGRVVVVEITAAGRDRMVDRHRIRAERLSELLADLSAEDRASIIRALEVTDRLAIQSPKTDERGGVS